mmetsp:Transcript_18094/g.25567  ORF Transcript_18094/g.25567 Transcript_18094/m.25567 type:complete len:103 (-) Transcript_18094:10-318(-)
MKMWVPSYLAGVPRILIGFRDSIGRYKSEEIFETLCVPEQAKNMLYRAECSSTCVSWEDLHCCLNFLDIVLNFLKRCVEEGKFYLLTYENGDLTLKCETSIG